MKDRRFIELLNLYVDQQIDSAEAAELEAEVLRSPERRRTYDQYCRLQRACFLLGEGACSVAPSSQRFARSLREAERKISEPRRPVWRTAYAGMYGAAAMAACVALVWVANRPRSFTDPQVDAQEVAFASPEVRSSEVKVAVVPAMAVESPLSSFDLHPVLAASGLGVARNAREAEIAASDREALEWMQRVDLLPAQRVVVDEQTFETRATLQPDNRVFRGSRSVQGNAEFTAFQFQR